MPPIDVLKEAVLRTGCLQAVTAVTGTGRLAPEVLAERLMLAVYAFGANCGIKSVASAGGHGEDEIRYAYRRYLTRRARDVWDVFVAGSHIRLPSPPWYPRLSLGPVGPRVQLVPYHQHDPRRDL